MLVGKILRKLAPSYTASRNLYKAFGKFLKNLSTELPHEPVTLLLGIYSEDENLELKQ